MSRSVTSITLLKRDECRGKVILGDRTGAGQSRIVVEGRWWEGMGREVGENGIV